MVVQTSCQLNIFSSRFSWRQFSFRWKQGKISFDYKHKAELFQQLWRPRWRIFTVIITNLRTEFIFGAFLSSNKRKAYMYRCMSEISGNLVFWFFRNKNRSNIWVDWFFLHVLRSRRLRTVNSKRSAKNWNINICNPNNRLTWSNKLEQPYYTFLYLSSSIFISAQEVQILVS